jgi:serine protease AprX
MPISIPRNLVEYILLGPAGDRRQLQDSPILGDVWIAFAKNPGEPQELLITPHNTQSTGNVAVELDQSIAQDRKAHPPEKEKKEEAQIAFLQGIIAARLYFDELLRVVVPMTEWWKDAQKNKEMPVYLNEIAGAARLGEILGIVGRMLDHWSAPTKSKRVDEFLSAFDRYAALAGIILWARSEPEHTKSPSSEEESIASAIKGAIPTISESLKGIFLAILATYDPNKVRSGDPLVYQVSLNRQASMALTRSVPAVKADAARSLFKVDCSKIAWAVIDAGIQGNHDCFVGAKGAQRVQASFDFSNYRRIVNLDNLRIFADGERSDAMTARLQSLLRSDLKTKLTEETAIGYLRNLANDLKFRRPVHWEFVEPFVEISTETRPPVSDHGTHVAGILGASREGSSKAAEDERDDFVDGMCPDIQLYDFRVIAEDVKDTEFAIIAVLQYIRHINERNDFITIHGANLSLSIPHDVRNYACGRTPVCVECERLVDSGVVVVAAAGNFGYQSFTTKEGAYESYAAFSVTDPGNADGVITVGATHRYAPHTYGVSFFSSRGPTGDGRLKPDLVAPGERIRAPFRKGWGDLDGTSMAAPHVSGAAAMLMARYSELIGQPRRIKQILCESATDLGRERSFQGHGMLDVLRAFQSI